MGRSLTARDLLHSSTNLNQGALSRTETGFGRQLYLATENPDRDLSSPMDMDGDEIHLLSAINHHYKYFSKSVEKKLTGEFGFKGELITDQIEGKAALDLFGKVYQKYLLERYESFGEEGAVVPINSEVLYFSSNVLQVIRAKAVDYSLGLMKIKYQDQDAQ